MRRPQLRFLAACGIIGGVILSVVLWNPALRASQVGHEQSKHEMIMTILRDSVMLDLMMDHIASDSGRSVQMVERLVYYAVGDTPRIERLCSQWIANASMQSLMRRQLCDTIADKRYE